MKKIFFIFYCALIIPSVTYAASEFDKLVDKKYYKESHFNHAGWKTHVLIDGNIMPNYDVNNDGIVDKMIQLEKDTGRGETMEVVAIQLISDGKGKFKANRAIPLKINRVSSKEKNSQPQNVSPVSVQPQLITPSVVDAPTEEAISTKNVNSVLNVTTLPATIPAASTEPASRTSLPVGQ